MLPEYHNLRHFACWTIVRQADSEATTCERKSKSSVDRLRGRKELKKYIPRWPRVTFEAHADGSKSFTGQLLRRNMIEFYTRRVRVRVMRTEQKPNEDATMVKDALYSFMSMLSCTSAWKDR